jgi:hypothetical protein
MAYNNYKTIYIENSFTAGLVVGSLRSHLASSGSGELTVKGMNDGSIVVEVATYNTAVMSYVEDMLSAFV